MPGVPETYYEILGVPRNATVREIKHAYRLLARAHHPDVSREAGAEDRFKRINEAYRVLSNPEERGRYDSLGHERYRRSLAGIRDFPGRHPASGFPGFEDVFDLFFSERSWGPAGTFRPKGVSDILARVEVSLGEAILGGEKEIEVPYAVRCAPCGGTGSTTRKVSPCPKCGGGGWAGPVAGRAAGPGSPACAECGGKGRIPEYPCTECGGWGATQHTRRVTVRIPPGIDSGMRIRKEGLGDERDPEIPGGDLYVEVAVLPHERFTRKGDDLETLIRISPARAVLGSEVEIATIDGRAIRVEIPPGVQHGATVRIGGGGVKSRDRCGDMVVRIQVETPGTIPARERDLYRRIARLEEEREGKRGKGILSRYFSGTRDAGR
jgi:molecular chaperone DnaJ